MVTASGNVRPIRIEEEMRNSYLSYAMSVIVSRALPDVRDGLKPVQRRILYAMHELSLRPNSQYKKCARIVGEVLGKYHPHGDSPVYEALVRMAQNFSMRYPLIDGQGNFGSIDSDPPAAMRYTEARLEAVAEEILGDIELDTVDFSENFDGSLKEPNVLPSLLPNMLLNGASGIAVGMATNIPPHNLTEICDAVAHLIDHPDALVEELMAKVPGPDFPTGAIIQGKLGIIDAYTTGQGKVVMQSRTRIEETRNGRAQIIVSELPYQVNKASLVEKIAHLIKDRRVDGISDIRDESDREGLRVVIELKRDAQPEVVLNNLFKHTPMRSAFHVMMLALVDGQPQILPLKRSLQLYIEHRRLIITRRSQHLVKIAKERCHIVEGLRLAIDSVDEVIAIIRGSADASKAKESLIEKLNLTDIQSQAILDMQLRRLAALEREKLEDEYRDLLKKISGLEDLLASPEKVDSTIRDDVKSLKKKFGGPPRRTEILEDEVVEHSRADLTPHRDVVVTISQRGYIKMIPVNTYKLQHRGGKGVRGMGTRDNDALQDVLVADTHDTLLFFTDKGRVYPLRCFDLPDDTSRTARGVPLVNLIPLTEGERPSSVLPINGLNPDKKLILVTRKGELKSVHFRHISKIRAKGLIIMKLKKGDEIAAACTVSISNQTQQATSTYQLPLDSQPPGDDNVIPGDDNVIPDQDKNLDDVIIVTDIGQSIRFSASEITSRSRGAGGVKGIKLQRGDRVVSMDVVDPQAFLLTISKGGFGKLSALAYYRRQSRRGVGIRTFRANQKTGRVAMAKVIKDSTEQEILLISASAQVIRINLSDLKSRGRNTSGLILWRDKEPDDYLVSLACLPDRGNDPSGEPND